VVKDVGSVKSVRLLGSDARLAFQPAAGGISIQLPDLPEHLQAQPAWVLKMNR
jgi:hypothetical protein